MVLTKRRWRVTIEEWDAEHFAWRNKRRISFEEACEEIAKALKK